MGYYDTIKAPYDSKSMIRAVFLFTQLHLLYGIYDVGYLSMFYFRYKYLESCSLYLCKYTSFSVI